MKIWQKYLFKKIVHTFFFFLFCLEFIYVIVDLSAHGVRFFSKARLSEIALFYLHNFSVSLDLFFALTFLLSTLQILFNLNTNRELLALQMAGLSKKTLLFPFFLFSGALSLVGYLNSQYFAPSAQEFSDRFKITYKAKKKTKTLKIHSIALDDESEIVYRHFDPKEKVLFDVFWVRKPDDLWHMKQFHIDSLEGSFVHHLTRNAAKQFEKTGSFEKKLFTELIWDHKMQPGRFIAYESRPISTLIAQASSYPADARILFSHLYYKLLTPLISFLIPLAIAPIVLRYTRTVPIFLITASAIFGLISLKIVLDGMLILGENQVLPSYIAIFSPLAILLPILLPAFRGMR